ncbi:uncharacterized protein LOC143810165 [Ranitomeya variabilis]|uniref:uncharacterized protein LOC143810165 n=1 Tax=Ranitomeya variabilis TaxID=490064 RepID=UPI004057A21C
MSARELRQLIADNEAWLRRPENQGQAITVHRLRSHQSDQGRPSTSDGRQRDINAVTERRGRRARAPPQRRRQEESRDRSRSPLRPAPAEPSSTTGESSRDGASQASGSAASTELEFWQPNPVLPSSSSREDPATNRYPVYGSQIQHVDNMLLQLEEMDRQIEHLLNILQLPVRMTPPQNGRRGQQIANLPTRDIAPQEETQSCVICMTEYAIGEQVTVLPCDHCFHQDCISPWLRSNPRCPLCRNHCFQ